MGPGMYPLCLLVISPWAYPLFPHGESRGFVYFAFSLPQAAIAFRCL